MQDVERLLRANGIDGEDKKEALRKWRAHFHHRGETVAREALGFLWRMRKT